jgi:serine/threonine protein kinase
LPIELAENYVEKRLSAREAGEAEAIERLRSEAALLERLSRLDVTPRILARGEDGRGPWHRIERVRLPTLAARLTQAGAALDPAWTERAARAAFAALATLHEATDSAGPLHVVHGDLSPANLAIDDAGVRAVVLDLDLASWRERASPSDGAFRGTLDYVAPEVARGERATCVSDLFALAASLLHAVIGAPPRSGRFDGEPTFPALLAAAAEAPLLRDEDRRLAGRGPGHAAILACLEHDPSRRPPSAREVTRAMC